MSKKNEEAKSVPDAASDLIKLIIDYAKQETIDPLKDLGRYIGFGAGGSLLLGVGGLMLALGLLRFVQDVTGTALTGNWSWVPYLVVLAVLSVCILLALKAIDRPTERGATS